MVENRLASYEFSGVSDMDPAGDISIMNKGWGVLIDVSKRCRANRILKLKSNTRYNVCITIEEVGKA